MSPPLSPLPNQPPLAASIRRPALAGCLALIVLTALVAYHRTFDVPFLWDDFANIVDNVALRDLFAATWARGATRPFAQLTFALNYAACGDHVAGWHAVNLAIHALCGVVMFDLVRRTLRLPRLHARFAHRADAIALASAVVWVAHPLHTSAVTYVVHRYESLAGLFYLATLALFARSVVAINPRKSRIAMLVCCLLGLATKEVVVTLPIVIVLYDYCFIGEPMGEVWRKRSKTHLALFALWGALAPLVAFGARNPSQGFGFTDLGPLDYARSELGVLVRYLQLTVWPRGLSIDYWDWPVAHTLAEVAGPACVVAAIVIGGLASLRRAPSVAFVALGWLIVLAPTSSFLPLKNELVAERRMYVPLALLIPSALAALDLALRKSPRLFAGSCAAIAAVLVGVTVARNADFRSTEKLFEQIVRTHPANVRARYHYGLALAARGAEDEALAQFQQAAIDGPRCAVCANNIGTVHARRRRFAEAEAAFVRAASLTPDDLTVRVNLVNVLIAEGKWVEAQQAQREVVRRDRSVVQLEKLARLLATAPDARARDGAEAVAIAEAAAEIARTSNATTLRLLVTLAAAYAEAGRWEEATAVNRALVDEAVRRGRPAMRVTAESMRARFAAREPWREGPDGVALKP